MGTRASMARNDNNNNNNNNGIRVVNFLISKIIFVKSTIL
jgi:hypothetical protein